jgi:hypothetical protein
MHHVVPGWTCQVHLGRNEWPTILYTRRRASPERVSKAPSSLFGPQDAVALIMGKPSRTERVVATICIRRELARTVPSEATGLRFVSRYVRSSHLLVERKRKTGRAFLN